MRLTDLDRRTEGGRVRLSARVVWEDARRDDEVAWIEAHEADAEGFTLRGETFALAALVPAMERGERRLVVDGTLCPLFVRNLPAAQRAMRAFTPTLTATEVVAAGGTAARRPAATPCTASTFSGGVDSFATIRANRLDLPADHPLAIRDAFFVFGMNGYDAPGGRPDEARRADADARVARWRPVAHGAGVRLVPVATSFRSLAVSFPSWTRRMIGSALAAVAHAFAGRVTRMLLSSAGGAGPLHPDGCHPLLDPFYGASDLAIVDDGTHRTRLEKLRVLAGWPEALAVLQPCQQHTLGGATPNCGACNKCHRTLVGLHALGLLDRATSFPPTRVDGAFVAGLRLANDYDVQAHLESAAALRADGQLALAGAIERRVAAYRRHRRWRELRRRLLGRRAEA
jgi:hypothetical protein